MQRGFIPGSTTNLGEGELDTPDFAFVPQAILPHQFQLGVPMGEISDMYRDKPNTVVHLQSSRFEGPTGHLVSLAVFY